MDKAAVAGLLLAWLLLAVLPAGLVYAGSTPWVEIAPKITIKGPQGKGKPATLAATGVLGTPPPDPDHRWAVVIGVSDYAGTENDIQYADDDALEVLRVLTEVYGYKRDHILLLISDYTVNNATRGDILAAIEWLRSVEAAGDEVLFYYSGHGARGLKADADKETVDEGVVPYEATTGSVIWDGDLASLFSTFDTTRIVFVFDSCYAGGMTDLAASGRIVVMATTETGLSYESGELRHGVFTYYFVTEGMFQGRADVYDHDLDGLLGEPTDVTIEEAFDYARLYAPAVSQQTPTISDSFGKDLLL